VSKVQVEVVCFSLVFKFEKLFGLLVFGTSSMGNAEVVEQEKDKTPSWAWKGAPKNHAQVPRSNSPIASLAARLAAIRVGQGTLSSSKATEAKTDLLEAERVCDDNKENLDTLGTWSYREPGFEQRLKSAAKSRAEMASATVQSVQGLEQELKNMRFRSSPKRASLDAAPAAVAVEADRAYMASSRERPSVPESTGLGQQATSTSSRVHSETRSPDSSTLRTEADVKGHWTRMWTQLSGTEDICADANSGQERRCQDDVRGGNVCGDSNWAHGSAPSDAGKIAAPSDGEPFCLLFQSFIAGRFQRGCIEDLSTCCFEDYVDQNSNSKSPSFF
jgi:hypothetical protein